MSAARIVPAFDELEAGHASLGLGAEFPPVEQFAFERREEALAHGVVIRVADRSHRRPDASLLAAETERHGRVLGGLNRSSQRFMNGGCDGEAEAWFGQGVKGADAVAWAAGCGEAGRSAAVLASDCGGSNERGCGAGRGRGPCGRVAVVQGGGRYATIAVCAVGTAALGAVSDVQRARGDRAVPRPRSRRSGDRAADWSCRIDGFARVATERSHSRRRSGVSGHHRAVARRAGWQATTSDEART